MQTFQELFDSHCGEPRLVNLTPHPVRLFVFPPVDPETDKMYQGWEWEEVAGKLGQWVEYAPESPPARMGETDGEASTVTAGVEDATFGMIVGVQASVVERELQAPELPEPDARFRYIVSLPLLMGLQAAGIHRDDLVAPDTGSGAVRDDQGRIVGVKRLVRLAPPNNNALDAYRNFVRFIANGAAQTNIDHLTCQNAANLLEEHGDPVEREQAKEAS